MGASENTITSRTRKQGGSVTTTIPTEVARKMGLRPGEKLFWVEDGSGGYHVVPMRTRHPQNPGSPRGCAC